MTKPQDNTRNWVNLDDIVLWDRNPNQGDVDKICNMIRTFGYRRPIGLWQDKITKSGNHRTIALRQLRQSGWTPDDKSKCLYVDADDNWFVEYTDDSDLDAQESDAWGIADNHSTRLGHDDPLLLTELLQELHNDDMALFEATGWDDSTLNELLSTITPPAPTDDPGAQVDRAEELNAKWQVQRGDLWVIPSAHGGEHRLLCGDSTVKEDVDRVINGLVTPLMVTDPPYGVEYDPTWREDYDNYERHARGIVQNDDNASWVGSWELSPCDVAYVWHADIYSSIITSDLEVAGYQIKCQIIWNKQHFVFGRGHYHWKHEPCWYAVRKGKTGHWGGDRKQSTVWDIANHNPHGGKADDTTTGHGTQKPVECMARPIRNHQGNVYDPFGGSGTTMVACEQLGRQCRMIEIEPKYISVILERMQGMGLEPVLSERIDHAQT